MIQSTRHLQWLKLCLALYVCKFNVSYALYLVCWLDNTALGKQGLFSWVFLQSRRKLAI